jgi:hypothetical protein
VIGAVIVCNELFEPVAEILDGADFYRRPIASCGKESRLSPRLADPSTS